METHKNEKPFACSKCDNKYDTEENLNQHRSTHTKENPIKCPKCEFSCYTNVALKDHMPMHTDEEPYKCSKCEYRFNSEAELNMHMKNHTDELLIDISFAEMVKSPSRKSESTPKRESSDGPVISASQPCKYSVQQFMRNKRGISTSPVTAPSHKKTKN